MDNAAKEKTAAIAEAKEKAKHESTLPPATGVAAPGRGLTDDDVAAIKSAADASAANRLLLKAESRCTFAVGDNVLVPSIKGKAKLQGVVARVLSKDC